MGERGLCICSAGDRSWRHECGGPRRSWAQGVREIAPRRSFEGFGRIACGPGKDTRRNRLCEMITSRLWDDDASLVVTVESSSASVDRTYVDKARHDITWHDGDERPARGQGSEEQTTGK